MANLFHGSSQALSRIIPGSSSGTPAVDDDIEEVAVTELDVEAAKERQRLMRAEESDDEDGMHRGGQRVQCAQQ